MLRPTKTLIKNTVCFSHSVVSDSLQPPDRSTPGFPVHLQLRELAQTQAHRVSDAIQPSHPLSSPSPLAFNLSQHQGLFQWVSSLHHVAKVLEFQLQHQSFQWIFRTDFLLMRNIYPWTIAAMALAPSPVMHWSQCGLEGFKTTFQIGKKGSETKGWEDLRTGNDPCFLRSIFINLNWWLSKVGFQGAL